MVFLVLMKSKEAVSTKKRVGYCLIPSVFHPIVDIAVVSNACYVPKWRYRFLNYVLFPITFICDFFQPKYVKNTFEYKYQRLARFYVCGIHVTVLLKFGILICLMLMGAGFLEYFKIIIMRRSGLSQVGHHDLSLDAVAEKLGSDESALKAFRNARYYTVLLFFNIIPYITQVPFFFFPYQIYWSFEGLLVCIKTIRFFYVTGFITWKEWDGTVGRTVLENGDDLTQFMIHREKRYQVIFEVITTCAKFYGHILTAYIVERAMQFYKWEEVLDIIQDWTIDRIKHIIEIVSNYTCRHVTKIMRWQPNKEGPTLCPSSGFSAPHVSFNNNKV